MVGWRNAVLSDCASKVRKIVPIIHASNLLTHRSFLLVRGHCIVRREGGREGGKDSLSDQKAACELFV